MNLRAMENQQNTDTLINSKYGIILDPGKRHYREHLMERRIELLKKLDIRKEEFFDKTEERPLAKYMQVLVTIIYEENDRDIIDPLAIIYVKEAKKYAFIKCAGIRIIEL